MNIHRRSAFRSMRKFLKQEGIKKGDVEQFRRLKRDDGTVDLIAILKDGRQAGIAWHPDPVYHAFAHGDGMSRRGGLL